jgi:pimeloyl-ACP methyl ester carboxylesterase
MRADRAAAVGRVLGEDGRPDKPRGRRIPKRLPGEGKETSFLDGLDGSGQWRRLPCRPLLMRRLADRYTLLAPALRGFGDSDKPDGPFGPDQHVADVRALLDALELPRVGIGAR